MSSHHECRSRHTISPTRRVLLRYRVSPRCRKQCSEKTPIPSLPSSPVGVVKPDHLPSTRHGTATTTLPPARARTACLEARELYHASAGHAVSGSTPQRLNNCQRKQLLPWWCRPLSQRQSLRACYACITCGITRGIRAKIAKMRDRKPPRNDRHQSTSHSSRAFSNH
jgi:hypothetical protein